MAATLPPRILSVPFHEAAGPGAQADAPGHSLVESALEKGVDVGRGVCRQEVCLQAQRTLEDGGSVFKAAATEFGANTTVAVSGKAGLRRQAVGVHRVIKKYA